MFKRAFKRGGRERQKRQEILLPCEEMSCSACVERTDCSWCDSGSAIGSAFGTDSTSGSCETGTSCSSIVAKAFTDEMQCPSLVGCRVCDPDHELNHISPCDDSTGRTVQFFCEEGNECPETIPCTICAYTDASSFPESCQWEKYGEAVLREPAAALVVGLLAPIFCVIFWLCRCCGLCGGCRRSKGFFRAKPRRDVKNPEDAYPPKEVLINRLAVYAVALALIIAFIVSATGNAAVTTATDQVMLDVINQADSLLTDMEYMSTDLMALNDRAYELADGRPNSTIAKRSASMLAASARMAEVMKLVKTRARFPIVHLLQTMAPSKRQSDDGGRDAFGSAGNDFNQVIEDALEAGNEIVNEARAVRSEVTEYNEIREDIMLAYFAVTFGLVFFAVAGACCKAPCCAKCFATVGPWMFFLATLMYVLHYVVVLGMDDGCVFLTAALNGDVGNGTDLGVGTGNPADFLTDCDAFADLDSMKEAVDDAITELYSIACDGVVQVCDFRTACVDDFEEQCDYATCPDFAPQCNETTLIEYLNITVFDLEIGCINFPEDEDDVSGRGYPVDGERNPLCIHMTNITQYGTPEDAQAECEALGFDAAAPCEARSMSIRECPNNCQNIYMADATWLVVEGTQLVDDYRLFWVEELRPLISCTRLTRMITQVLDFGCINLRNNMNTVAQGMKWCIVFYCFAMFLAVLGSKRFTDAWDDPDNRPMRRMARRLPHGEEALLAAEEAGQKLDGAMDFDDELEEEGEVSSVGVSMVELGEQETDDEDEEARIARLRSSVALSAIDDDRADGLSAKTDDQEEGMGGTYEAPPAASARASVALEASEPPPPFAPDSDEGSAGSPGGTIEVPAPPAPVDEGVGTAEPELLKVARDGDGAGQRSASSVREDDDESL
jgi:hypothetical protein